MYRDLSSVAGWPEMDNPDRIKASRPESPLPLYFSALGPKWLPLTSGPGLIISRPVSLFVGRFLSPPPPTSMLLGKGGGWNVSLGGWKLFSRSCGRRVPLNHCLPRSTPEMSETAITWTLHVFCQNLLIKVRRPHWERKRPAKFDLKSSAKFSFSSASHPKVCYDFFSSDLYILKHRVSEMSELSSTFSNRTEISAYVFKISRVRKYRRGHNRLPRHLVN